MDTGFLSALLKVDRLDLPLKLVDTLLVTMEVYDELTKCKALMKPLVGALRKGCIEIVESYDYKMLWRKYPELGSGELSVIASAGSHIAFVEDRDAEKTAEKEGVLVFNLPELLLACKEKGLITNAEIKQIIKKLKQKDRYLLKKEVEEELLR